MRTVYIVGFGNKVISGYIKKVETIDKVDVYTVVDERGFSHQLVESQIYSSKKDAIIGTIRSLEVKKDQINTEISDLVKQLRDCIHDDIGQLRDC